VVQDLVALWLAAVGVDTAYDCWVKWWIDSRMIVPKARHPAFDFLAVLVAWSIWLHRNDSLQKHWWLAGALVDDRAWLVVEQWCKRLG
jgi:hypothetical protein